MSRLPVPSNNDGYTEAAIGADLFCLSVAVIIGADLFCLSVAVIMTATLCGLKLRTLENQGLAEGKDVRKKCKENNREMQRF
jgi:hypothetical protein